jgi:hypothetical protein
VHMVKGEIVEPQEEVVEPQEEVLIAAKIRIVAKKPVPLLLLF